MNFLAATESTFIVAASLYFIHLMSFLKLILLKQSTNSVPPTYPFASVLICAKNEATNLKNYLPIILNQDYLNFEVVVINDQSSDESLSVLHDFQKKNSRLKVFTTSGESSKKKALALAKKEASGTVYVLTDADCKIASENWLSKMITKMEDSAEVVLGYAPYKNKSGFLNRLQIFETLTTAMQYFTAALFGSPYMGVGRNLAYTKQIDTNIKFTKKENQLLSGDDDLWIQKAKKHTQIQIQLDQDTFAYSEAEPTFTSWWNQKKRHITTANQYSWKDQMILSSIFLTKFLFWTCSFILFFTSLRLQFWLLFFVVITALMLVYKSTTHKLKEEIAWWLTPILDFSLIYFQFCLFISNLVSPITKWK